MPFLVAVSEWIDAVSERVQTLYRNHVSFLQAMRLEEFIDPVTLAEEIPGMPVAVAPRDVCLDRVGQAFHQKRELASRALLGVRLAVALLGEEVVVPGDIEVAVPKVSFGDGDQPLPIFNAAAHS